MIKLQHPLYLLLLIYSINLSAESHMLKPCPDKPNCINTEYPNDQKHFVEPLVFSDKSLEQVASKIKSVIVSMGGTFIKDDKFYIYATFTSGLFKFVDDFEVRIDEVSQQIHIRSASRTGYYDFGVNGKRVKEFITKMK